MALAIKKKFDNKPDHINSITWTYMEEWQNYSQSYLKKSAINSINTHTYANIHTQNK